MRAILVPLLLALSAVPLAGQAPGHSTGTWRQVETEHFLFLYPEPLSEWALAMARRMEAVHGAVSSLVGYAPEERVTVLVDDPSNVSNGSMNPGPLLYLWPTPPGPRSVIGENRGWGELLAVHEFAHAAHLTRPTRNPRGRFLWGLLPIPLEPLFFRTPRWAVEGYATYVEGRLTGSGRPHGAWRPAVLRTWALEGQLPTYGALSGSRSYLGGSMAYLAGSAYLEWLVDREGGEEVVLPNVWRRLTARQKRSFGSAFTGVFGAPPSELYGLFTVDVTERALAVRDAVEAAGGVVEGELFQRLTWSTGDPSVSPDGEHLALVLRSRLGPSRLVVVSTTPDTLTTEQEAARARIVEADPEDVEPVQRRPRPQRPKATLRPTVGRAYEAPAFMPDGRGILVVRSDITGNAQNRTDLFLWDWEEDTLRRITEGAAIREADPSPDGTWAAGLRCLHARCDIVRVDLGSGAVTTLAPGHPLRPYDRPRVSPDGRTIVASLQVGTGWRLVAMDADGGNLRFLGPDDGASRFDADFLPDGRALVLTSTRGGIHDLERLDMDTGDARPLTRVLGAAVAPAPTPDGDVFFLSMHSRGWDLRRRAGDAPPATPVVALDPALSPAAPVPPVQADTFGPVALGPIRPYGLGPRFRVLLPMASLDVDGQSGGLALGGTDPIGRLSWQLQGLHGTDDAWRGAALRMLWRASRPWIHLEGFMADGTLPGRTPGADFIDAAYRGGAGSLELRHPRLGRTQHLRLGGSAGRLGDLDRVLGFAGYDLSLLQMPGTLRLRQSAGLLGAAGRTDGLGWWRWRATAALSLRGRSRGIGLSGTLGGTDAPAASVEAFQVGGLAPPLFDEALLSQRVTMPALHAGTLGGDVVRTARAELYGFGPGTFFYWAGSADGDGLGWYHVAGLELDQDIAGVPYVRLPAVRIRAGLARTLSDPDEGDWRAWAALHYLP